MVRRESAFPPPVVQGQRSPGTSTFAAACAPCLALPMGIHAFVQRGSGAGLVVVGREGWPRGGWTQSFGRRRGVGRPVRCVSSCEFCSSPCARVAV